MERINSILSYTVHLENLINERDEYISLFDLLVMKLGIFRSYGDLDEGAQNMLQDLDDKSTKAKNLLAGVDIELIEFAQVSEPEEARKKLTHLKSVLNHYMETTAQEFIVDTLANKSVDELLSIGVSLIGVENAVSDES